MDSAAVSHAMDRKNHTRGIWQIPTFLLGLAALLAAYVYVPRPAANPQSLTEAELVDLQIALEQKPVDAATIEPLLKKLAASGSTDNFTNFLIGSGYVALADLSGGENSPYWEAAVQAFSRCDPQQFQRPADVALFAFRNAMAQAATGSGHPNELLQALMAPPPGEVRRERLRLIAEAALRTASPDRKLAKESYSQYLGSANSGSAATLARHKLELAKLHRADKEFDKAKAWLADIASNAPANVQALANMQLGQLAMDEQQWQEAISCFQSALASSSLPQSERGPIRYLCGLALMRTGNDEAAIPHLLQAAREPGSLGGSAAMYLAQIRNRRSEGTSRREAADWLEKAVTQVGASNDPSKTSELRAVFEDVIQASRAEGDYATALRATNAYAKVADGKKDRSLRAEIYERWAEALLKTNPAQAKPKLVDAANEFTEMAESCTDPVEKAHLLRRAATHWARAGENSKALGLVTTVLVTPGVKDELISQTWLDRADLLPKDRAVEIEDCLKKAMAIPGPAATKARYKLAISYVKRARDKRAVDPVDSPSAEAESLAKLGRDMLAQIADASTVLPEDASTHELALFELGRLSMIDRQYVDAEARFRKQLQLYPTAEHADNARLWIASALLARAQVDSGSATKARSEALVHLKELAKSDDSFLRTWGEIWQANTLLQMGEIATVIPLCKELTVKHQGTLEELVLGKLLVHAYLTGPTPRIEEARATFQRMEELFAKLPRESYRTDPEYSYEHWKSELPRLKELLTNR